MKIARQDILAQCSKRGAFVYVLRDGDEAIYVGSTLNLSRRMFFHRTKSFTSVEIIKVPKAKRVSREYAMIRDLKPKLNSPMATKKSNRPRLVYPKLVLYVTKEELRAFKAKAVRDNFRNVRLWALCVLTGAVK